MLALPRWLIAVVGSSLGTGLATWMWESQVRVAVHSRCLLAGQQRRRLARGGERGTGQQELGWHLARRWRATSWAREPDACPCQLDSPAPHLLLVDRCPAASAAALLGSPQAGGQVWVWVHGLLAGGQDAGVGRRGVPPPKTFRWTLGQLEA